MYDQLQAIEDRYEELGDTVTQRRHGYHEVMQAVE